MPRLVLPDLRVPRMDRMDALEALRCVRTDERKRRLGVAMSSTTGFPEDATEAYRPATNAFVGQRFSSAPYAKTVGRILRFRVDVNRTPPLNASKTARW